MKQTFSIIFICLFSSLHLFGQSKIIKIKNSSFEGNDQAGQYDYFNLPFWHDCAPDHYFRETAPDIHSSTSNHFSVQHLPYDGKTFLGLVTREIRETYEMVSQQLSTPMKANTCYKFSIYLAKADVYLSPVSATVEDSKKNFNSAIKLRIWGSDGDCSKIQMLAQTTLVNHSDWRQYNLKFKTSRDYSHILFEAYYKTPVLVPYNGNILLDKASDIVEVPCPDKIELAKVEIKKPTTTTSVTKKTEPAVNKSSIQKQKPKTEKRDKKDSVIAKKDPIKVNENKDKILMDLNKDKLSVGQVIKIEKLFFDADSANIKPESYPVLDELYTFLNENQDIIIEIGGHTNSIPNEDYCNKLSLDRAKNVAEYLYKMGISTFRIKFRGYGKTKPISLDNNLEGRRKNQRVEIKILHTGR
jgi:outer membrane protein OmpA-like peptidoglycan-associated protein